MLLSIQPKIKHKVVPKQKDWSEGWLNKDWSVNQLVKHVTSGGAMSVAAVKDEYRDTEHFISSQVIGMDFDDNAPDVSYFAEEEPLAKDYAFFVYPTSSSTPDNPRTRVLFQLDQVITDPVLYRRYVLRVMYWYSYLKPDPKCKDPTRIFFGSVQPDYYLNPKVMLPLAVLDQLPDPPIQPGQTTGERLEEPLTALLDVGAGEGNRNNAALRLVGHYANVLPPDEIRLIMRMWYDTKVSNKRDFTWETVESMIDRMVQKSGGVYTQVRDTIEKARALPSTPQNVQVNPAFKTTTFGDFIGGDEQPIKWAIEGWLPEATTGGIIAPPESYKTWLALAMAMSLATGEPFLGEYKTSGAAPVLLIQQEDSKGLLRQRLRVIYAQLWEGKTVVQEPGIISLPVCVPDLHIYEGDATFKFDNPEMLKNLTAYVEKHGIKLVLLDPLYAATDANDYMAKDAQRMVELKRIRDRFGCSFLIVHHTKKTVADTTQREDSWGSQFLNAWLEMGIQIRKKGPGRFKLFRHFKNSPQVAEQVLEVSISTDPEDYHFYMKVTDENETPIEESQLDQIMGLINDAPKNQLSSSKIATGLGKSASWTSTNGKGLELLRVLVKMGKLVVTVKGNSTIYTSTELANF